MQDGARARMDELKEQILASIEADPEDYDSREELWMEREDLRAGLAAARNGGGRVSTSDMQAIARGYQAMYGDALTALLRIRDECDSRDEMHRCAFEVLAQLGEDE